MSSAVLLLLMLLPLGAASAAAQTPTFSARLDVIRVDALVTDRGRPVPGLGAADFEIVDNGVGQQVDLASFDDIVALADDCHFTDCRHENEPRCAVKAAVAAGELSTERLGSYVKLHDEIRALDAKRDVRAQIDEKRRSKTIGKSMKQLYKDRGRE